jgi:hypothetical protein
MYAEIKKKPLPPGCLAETQGISRLSLSGSTCPENRRRFIFRHGHHLRRTSGTSSLSLRW